MTTETTPHPYFTDKARATFAESGGDPDLTADLAAWAEAAHGRDDVHGVIVALDGTIVAETVHIDHTYIHGPDAQRLGLTYRELGMALGEIKRVIGQDVIHLKRWELTRGAGKFALQGHRAAVESARESAAEASEALRSTTIAAVHAGVSEVEAARLAGVARMTVRSWLGK